MIKLQKIKRKHTLLPHSLTFSLSVQKVKSAVDCVLRCEAGGEAKVALRVKRPDIELSAAAIAASKDRERERREVARTS